MDNDKRKNSDKKTRPKPEPEKMLASYPIVCDESKIQKNDPNLLHLLIMVKNGGPNFQAMLRHNLAWVDQCTILDTGSTDGTWEMLQEAQKEEDCKGKLHLFQEPFLNFRDSRNRLLDLAAKDCYFQIILDDTYHIENGKVLRQFLSQVKTADPNSYQSFSLYIQSSDGGLYLSNRILRTSAGLRYDARYRIHEIIQQNLCFSIPKEYAYLTDRNSKDMENRTNARKQYDLDLLLEDYEAHPESLRLLYYIAETYLYMEKYDKAFEFYRKRALNGKPGDKSDYAEEKYDAFYKMGVIQDLHLAGEPGQTWESRVLPLYLQAHKFCPTRPEALFMCGYHYAQPNSRHDDLAFLYLRRCFELGAPSGGMNLKLQQYYEHLPTFLVPLCLTQKDYALGLKVTGLATQFPVSASNANKQARYRRVFQTMIARPAHRQETVKIYLKNLGAPKKPWICFVTSSGWRPYNGKTLLEKGLGGSETCIIRFAEEIVRQWGDEFRVAIFCPCDAPFSCFQGVYYFDIAEYTTFLQVGALTESLGTRVFLQRSPEFLLATTTFQVPCYLHLHDTLPEEEVLIGHTSAYFRGTICLTHWHKQLFEQAFASVPLTTFVQRYGLTLPGSPLPPKLSHSFIYPSFPNRGLAVLIGDLWPRILKLWPDARLSLFCDFDNAWLQSVAGPEMKALEREIREKYLDSIVNYGWQPPGVLRERWAATHFWLYPCTFAETFCLTALEAQVFQAHVVTCDLAALAETARYCPSSRVIPGDPKTREWQDQALEALQSLDGLQKPAPWDMTQVSYPVVVTDFMNAFCGS